MSAANYALCDSCDGKVFYVGDEDIPLDAVVTHVDCQIKELAKVRAEGRRQAAEAIAAHRDKFWPKDERLDSIRARVRRHLNIAIQVADPPTLADAAAALMAAIATTEGDGPA